MKEFARPARELPNSSESFHQRLNSYALAASAAGVSLLALAQSSEAKIIYTRTHHVIRNRGSYDLDLNHDGTTDLTIQNNYFHTSTPGGSSTTIETLAAQLARTNQVVYNVYGAVAMKPGMRIGPDYPFRSGGQRMAYCSGHLSFPIGSWVNVKNRYLGVKFNIKGKTHYGWARLSVQIQLPFAITATLTGYAYETVPNKPIIAGATEYGAADTIASPGSAKPINTAAGTPVVGKISNTLPPGSLAGLALGAQGVPMRRRRAF